MDWSNPRDLILLAIGAFIAVTTLVGLMIRRREELIAKFRGEFEVERERLRVEERRRKVAEKKKAAKNRRPGAA